MIGVRPPGSTTSLPIWLNTPQPVCGMRESHPSVPFSPVLEQAYVPDAARIAAEVRALVGR